MAASPQNSGEPSPFSSAVSAAASATQYLPADCPPRSWYLFLWHIKNKPTGFHGPWTQQISIWPQCGYQP